MTILPKMVLKLIFVDVVACKIGLPSIYLERNRAPRAIEWDDFLTKFLQMSMDRDYINQAIETINILTTLLKVGCSGSLMLVTRADKIKAQLNEI
jgi:hypothetical protein